MADTIPYDNRVCKKLIFYGFCVIVSESDFLFCVTWKRERRIQGLFYGFFVMRGIVKRGRRTEKMRSVESERSEKRGEPNKCEERVLSFSGFGKKG